MKIKENEFLLCEVKSGITKKSNGSLKIIIYYKKYIFAS